MVNRTRYTNSAAKYLRGIVQGCSCWHKKPSLFLRENRNWRSCVRAPIYACKYCVGVHRKSPFSVPRRTKNFQNEPCNWLFHENYVTSTNSSASHEEFPLMATRRWPIFMRLLLVICPFSVSRARAQPKPHSRPVYTYYLTPVDVAYLAWSLDMPFV